MCTHLRDYERIIRVLIRWLMILANDKNVQDYLLLIIIRFIFQDLFLPSFIQALLIYIISANNALHLIAQKSMQFLPFTCNVPTLICKAFCCC